MQPAARLGDMHVCPMFDGPKPHIGGPILPPCVPTVMIGGMPAAVVGNPCLCIGPPDFIVGCYPKVLVGGRPVARMGDMTAHGGIIALGCFNVLIGPDFAAMLSSFWTSVKDWFSQNFSVRWELKEGFNLKKIKAKLKLVKGTLHKDGYEKFGKYELGVEASGDGVGAKAAFTAWEAERDFVSDSGFTFGVKAKALAAEGFVGVNPKTGEAGAKVGATVASVGASVGKNVGNYNVGADLEVGLKWDFGFKVGKQTEIKFGPVSVGFGFGPAKKSTVPIGPP